MKITGIALRPYLNNFSNMKKVGSRKTDLNFSEINLNCIPNYKPMMFGQKRKVSNGDLTPYEIVNRTNPNAVIPKVEQEKFDLSVKAEKYIEEENYLEALKTKVKIASICQNLRQTRDAYLLEVTIRELYAALPQYQKEEAKNIISIYNSDMAKYIDIDTSNM